MLQAIHGGSEESLPPWMRKRRELAAMQSQRKGQPKAYIGGGGKIVTPPVLTPKGFDMLFPSKSRGKRAGPTGPVGVAKPRAKRK